MKLKTNIMAGPTLDGWSPHEAFQRKGEPAMKVKSRIKAAFASRIW